MNLLLRSFRSHSLRAVSTGEGKLKKIKEYDYMNSHVPFYIDKVS